MKKSGSKSTASSPSPQVVNIQEIVKKAALNNGCSVAAAKAIASDTAIALNGNRCLPLPKKGLSLRDLSRTLITGALTWMKGDRNKVAAYFGVTAKTVYNKVPLEKEPTGPVICRYCNKPAEWVSNEEVYGKRMGRYHMIWLCRGCGAYARCKGNSRRPKGVMADPELRLYRKHVYDVMAERAEWHNIPIRKVKLSVEDYLERDASLEKTSSVNECKDILKAIRSLFGG